MSFQVDQIRFAEDKWDDIPIAITSLLPSRALPDFGYFVDTFVVEEICP